MASGLFTLIVLSLSIIRPPPSPTCHSSAFQVKPSPAPPHPPHWQANPPPAAPGHTKPQKSFCPLARSPCWILAAIFSSWSHVLGGVPYPYSRRRSFR